MFKFLTLLGLALPVLAQNAVSPPPVHQQFFDASGRPLANGRVYICSAGTTCPGNPIATWTDSTAAVLNANPVVLDSSGYASIWIKAGPYKFVAQKADGSQQWTQDNITNTGFVLGQTLDALKCVANGLACLDSSVRLPEAELTQYNQGGTGAVSRNIPDKLREQVDIADFGAVGDNTTDNLAAFQRAVNALPAQGGKIHFGPGKWVISSTWVISKPGVVVEGCGSVKSPVFDASDTAACVIKYTGGAAPAISIQANAVHMSGFTLDNTGSGTIGIEIKGNYTDLSNIAVYPAVGFSNAAFKTDPSAVRQDERIDRVFVQGNAHALILDQTIAAHITNFRSVKNGTAAIVVGDTISCFSIWIQGVFDVFDQDGLSAAAIEIKKANNVTIKDSYFELAEYDSTPNAADSGQVALRLNPQFNNDNQAVIFEGNWIQGNSIITYAISSPNTNIVNGLTVIGNIFRDCVTAGMNVPAADPIAVISNNKWGITPAVNAITTNLTRIDSGLAVTGQLQSNVATGTAPLAVTSSTPVNTLVVANHPTLFDSSSNPTSGVHMAYGGVSLSGTTATVTLTGNAVYTNTASYVCFVTGSSSTATRGVTRSSGSQFTITSSASGEAGVSYVCIGK